MPGTLRRRSNPEPQRHPSSGVRNTFIKQSLDPFKELLWGPWRSHVDPFKETLIQPFRSLKIVNLGEAT